MVLSHSPMNLLKWVSISLLAAVSLGISNAAEAQAVRNVGEYNLDNGIGLKGHDPVKLRRLVRVRHGFGKQSRHSAVDFHSSRQSTSFFSPKCVRQPRLQTAQGFISTRVYQVSAAGPSITTATTALILAVVRPRHERDFQIQTIF